MAVRSLRASKTPSGGYPTALNQTQIGVRAGVCPGGSGGSPDPGKRWGTHHCAGRGGSAGGGLNGA